MKLKKKQIESLLERIIILIDTREKNSHILETYEKCKKQFEFTKLNFGDYSFRVNHQIEGLKIDFTDMISIERKADLDEMSKCLTTDRRRFKDELIRSQNAKSFTIMIENATYEDILRKNYRSKLPVKSFFATLFTYQARYGIDLMFLNSLCSANYIHNRFRYFLREYLINIDI